jgi:hypothetical protein
MRPAVALALAVTLVLLPLTAGCSHRAGYCDTVRDHQSDLGSIARAGDRTGLISALPIFEDLQDAAPDDVGDDWQLLVTRIRALDTALEDADVDPATYDPKQPPAGLSPDERGEIRQAAAELAASDTQEALARLQQEVLDVCHTPLEL